MGYASDYISVVDRNDVDTCTSDPQEMERDDTYFLDNVTFLVSNATLNHTVKRVDL
jgi:hypothetical protein